MTFSFAERRGLRRLPLLVCAAAMLGSCGGDDHRSSSAGSGSASSSSVSSSSSSSGNPLGASYLYVASTTVDDQGTPQPGTVNAFAVNSDGSLMPLSATVTIGLPPNALVSDPSGHFVYAINGDGSISAYSVEASDGTLTPLPAVPATAQAQSGVQASIDPKGQFLYVVQQRADTAVPEHTIVHYRIGSDGNLQPAGTITDEANSAASGPLSFDASGHAYLASTDAISQYTIASDGSLTPMNPASVPGTPTVVGLALAGSFAYAFNECVNTDCSSQVALYSLGPSGALTSTGTTTTLTTADLVPVALGEAFTANQSAYLLANSTGAGTPTGMILPYAVDAETGALTPGTAVNLANGMAGVAEVIGPGAVDNRPGAPLNLYVLSTGALANATGQIDHYVLGEQGAITYGDSTSLTQNSPVAMTLVAIGPVVPASP